MKVEKEIVSGSEPQVIADNLRALFKKRRVSESEVALALNIPVMTIRRLLSGETTDPRVFTLKTIADYFDISVDVLLEEKEAQPLELSGKNKSIFVPVFDWATLEKSSSIIKDINLSEWKDWHLVSLWNSLNLGKNSFALESRPFMYPRFQNGTLFIIDPDTSPSDGDLVLIKINKSNEITLRELKIDSPDWQLHPVVPGSTVLEYDNETYSVVGVVLLTLFYNRRS
jgi:transcriptional regulator with XRE-family HTH domain